MNLIFKNTNVHILVVDDDEAIRKYMVICLARLGYSCDQAANAYDACELLRERVYDLVIADIQMPGNDSLQMLNVAEEIAPGVPFILATGLPAQASLVAEIGEQVQAFLEKPLDRVLLQQTVERVLRLNKLAKTQSPADVDSGFAFSQ